MSQFVGNVRDSLVEVDGAGKFIRTATGFRNIINKDHEIFKPECGRYHLYISYACPWANRCLAARNLKGLEGCIGLTIVHPTWQRTKPDDPTDTHNGWIFAEPTQALKSSAGFGSFVMEECSLDPLNGAKTVRDLYDLSGDTFKKYSVPVLWDKKTNQIVNNESSEILRMFSDAFNEWASDPKSFYPAALRAQIDATNDWIYPNINDGVYKCGFAKSQGAYDEAVNDLFNSLDRLESILASQKYLVNNVFTEADIRLFMTLVRFDEVYVVYFKCNVRMIKDYPNILNYCRDIYQMPAMKSCINMKHIKTHYFSAHPVLNAYSVIPKGGNFIGLLEQPHDRNRFD